MTAACATPTAWVLVIVTGPEKVPDSSIQLTPVISPLPFWEKNPAATGSPAPAWPRGVDRGHAGPDRFALDQGRVAHLHARHVGDRVPPAGGAGQRDAERPGPRPSGRGGGMPGGQVSGHRSGILIHGGERGRRRMRHPAGICLAGSRPADPPPLPIACAWAITKIQAASPALSCRRNHVTGDWR